MSISPYELSIKKAKAEKAKQEETTRKGEKHNSRMAEAEDRIAAIRRGEHAQKEATYKVVTARGDRVVRAGEIPALMARKEIKPETRIYNNETNQWIEFKDYSRLHTLLKTLPAKQPKDEDTYKILLDGRHHDLTLYRIERLLKNGTIKPDTQIYNYETECWINFREYSGLSKRLNILGSEKSSLRKKDTDTGSSSLLMECPKCNHSYSKRADKCPKCGSSVTAACAICKSMIPKSTKECPECGDPAPFEDSRVVSLETPVRAHADKPIQKQDQAPNKSTSTPTNRKKMNQFLRWAIIIGSSFGILLIIACLRVMAGESRMRLYDTYLPMIAFYVAFYLTRTKKSS